ncbi:MAG: HD domain-containing protein, partial [bacterium]|nr:HD domain-containing protein [bacterium]
MQKVSEILKKLMNLDDVYIVGGAARNMFIKKEIKDIDIVSFKINEENLAKKVAKMFNSKPILIDKENRTFRIPVDDITIDVTRKRASNIIEDLKLRDFTINAIAFKNDKLIDPLNGIADIKEKRLKLCYKNALKDDPLRIFRAFRFISTGFKPEKDLIESIKKNRKLIKNVANERIAYEIKLILNNDAYNVIELMDNTNVIETIIDNKKDLEKCGEVYYGKGGVWSHLKKTLFFLEDLMKNKKKFFSFNFNVDPVTTKIAGLLHDIGKPLTAKVVDGRLRFLEHDKVGALKAEELLKKLRFANSEIEVVKKLILNHMRLGNLANQGIVTKKAVYRFFRDLGNETLAMILISLADHRTYLSKNKLNKSDSVHKLAKDLVN